MGSWRWEIRLLDCAPRQEGKVYLTREALPSICTQKTAIMLMRWISDAWLCVYMGGRLISLLDLLLWWWEWAKLRQGQKQKKTLIIQGRIGDEQVYFIYCLLKTFTSSTPDVQRNIKASFSLINLIKLSMFLFEKKIMFQPWICTPPIPEVSQVEKISTL